MATSKQTSAQVDVPMIKEPQAELSTKSEEEGELVTRTGTEVQLPAQTEAGRQESIVEDLQPLGNDPPPERDTDRQRDTRTGYSLRRKPKKARSKDL